MSKNTANNVHADDKQDVRIVDAYTVIKPGNVKYPAEVIVQDPQGDKSMTYKIDTSKTKGLLKGQGKPVKGTLVTVSGFHKSEAGDQFISAITKSLNESFEFVVGDVKPTRGDERVTMVSGQIQGDHPRAGAAQLLVRGRAASTLKNAFEIADGKDKPDMRINVLKAQEKRDGVFSVSLIEQRL